MGVPPNHHPFWNAIFQKINHPAIGVPPVCGQLGDAFLSHPWRVSVSPRRQFAENGRDAAAAPTSDWPPVLCWSHMQVLIYNLCSPSLLESHVSWMRFCCAFLPVKPTLVDLSISSNIKELYSHVGCASALIREYVYFSVLKLFGWISIHSSIVWFIPGLLLVVSGGRELLGQYCHSL